MAKTTKVSKKLEAIQTILTGFTMLYEAVEEQEKMIVASPCDEEKTEESLAPTEIKNTREEKKNEIVSQDKGKKSEEKSEPKKEPVKEEVKEEISEENQENDLESMTDTELKALARDMGIKIILGMKRARIIEAVREKIKEENKKKIETQAVEELPEDSLMKRLKEETADMTDEEIREILSDADISEKGGRTALIAKLYDAVKNGLIEFGDEEEESVNEEDAEDAIVNSEEEEEKDTPERISAMEAFEKENREAFEKGELEVGDMKSFLKENFEITMPKKATPTEVLDAYIEHAVNFIDDDGNTVEEGAYTVKGVPFCCGVPLEISKDKQGKTIAKCKICGESYKVDDSED